MKSLRDSYKEKLMITTVRAQSKIKISEESTYIVITPAVMAMRGTK